MYYVDSYSLESKRGDGEVGMFKESRVGENRKDVHVYRLECL